MIDKNMASMPVDDEDEEVVDTTTTTNANAAIVGDAKTTPSNPKEEFMGQYKYDN